jgi:hypothetical protein
LNQIENNIRTSNFITKTDNNTEIDVLNVSDYCKNQILKNNSGKDNPFYESIFIFK